MFQLVGCYAIAVFVKEPLDGLRCEYMVDSRPLDSKGSFGNHGKENAAHDA